MLVKGAAITWIINQTKRTFQVRTLTSTCHQHTIMAIIRRHHLGSRVLEVSLLLAHMMSSKSQSRLRLIGRPMVRNQYLSYKFQLNQSTQSLGRKDSRSSNMLGQLERHIRVKGWRDKRRCLGRSLTTTQMMKTMNSAKMNLMERKKPKAQLFSLSSIT